MEIVTTRAELQAALEPHRVAGRRIAFVPTMGFLHEGHLRLVDHAHKHGDVVVMSIYVNPLQFGPSEDLARYPRDLDRDADLARKRGVSVIFAPSDDEIYPGGRPGVTVHAPELSNHLCGLFRPGHFEGVLTVVAKLFNIVEPDVAVFGQKDYQQSVLIRRMVVDLNFNVRIEVAPIIREPDGLAMSSRNVFLKAEDRQAALTLSRALRAAQQKFEEGEHRPAELVRVARAILEADRDVRLQYVELVEEPTLGTPQRAEAGNVIAVAGFVGKTRLIDNVILG